METKEKSAIPIPSYPKIWHVGGPEVEDLFKGEVEITEKIDGSQFSFGKSLYGTPVMRSKGQQVFPETADKNFRPVVDWVQTIQHLLPADTYIYGETLARPKHNTLKYNNVPKGNFALFSIRRNDGNFVTDYDVLVELAGILGCDVVPLLFKGDIKGKEELEELLKKESFLGGEIVEGVVVKNYNQYAKSAFSRECFAKIVRPEFKERHSNNTAFASKKDNLDDFLSQFQTEARWNKAIFRLRDQGLLESSPKDIGKLILEVQTDLITEEEPYIKEALFKMFKKQITGRAVKGLPEFYKKVLIEKQFGNLNV